MSGSPSTSVTKVIELSTFCMSTNSSAYVRVVLVATLALSPVGCDEADQDTIEQGQKSFEHAGEALKRAGQSVKEVATDLILPPRREAQLGDRMAREVLAESQPLRGTPVVRYVQKLGRRVVESAQSRPEGIDFEFHVLRDSQINAFAIPGGHIFVTTGLLEAAESEAELIAVLGHEVAHVTQRHIAERMTAVYGISTLTSLALGEDAGMLEQIAVDLVAQGYLLKHSRDDEREADQKGMQFVIDAGYSPVGYVAFFERLSKQPQPPALLSTHPNPEERAQRARRALELLDEDVVAREVHRERYREMTSSL